MAGGDNVNSFAFSRILEFDSKTSQPRPRLFSLKFSFSPEIYASGYACSKDVLVRIFLMVTIVGKNLIQVENWTGLIILGKGDSNWHKIEAAPRVMSRPIPLKDKASRILLALV